MARRGMRGGNDNQVDRAAILEYFVSEPVKTFLAGIKGDPASLKPASGTELEGSNADMIGVIELALGLIDQPSTSRGDALAETYTEIEKQISGVAGPTADIVYHVPIADEKTQLVPFLNILGVKVVAGISAVDALFCVVKSIVANWKDLNTTDAADKIFAELQGANSPYTDLRTSLLVGKVAKPTKIESGKSIDAANFDEGVKALIKEMIAVAKDAKDDTTVTVPEPKGDGKKGYENVASLTKDDMGSALIGAYPLVAFGDIDSISYKSIQDEADKGAEKAEQVVTAKVGDYKAQFDGAFKGTKYGEGFNEAVETEADLSKTSMKGKLSGGAGDQDKIAKLANPLRVLADGGDKVAVPLTLAAISYAIGGGDLKLAKYKTDAAQFMQNYNTYLARCAAIDALQTEASAIISAGIVEQAYAGSKLDIKRTEDFGVHVYLSNPVTLKLAQTLHKGEAFWSDYFIFVNKDGKTTKDLSGMPSEAEYGEYRIGAKRSERFALGGGTKMFGGAPVGLPTLEKDIFNALNKSGITNIKIGGKTLAFDPKNLGTIKAISKAAAGGTYDSKTGLVTLPAPSFADQIAIVAAIKSAANASKASKIDLKSIIEAVYNRSEKEDETAEAYIAWKEAEDAYRTFFQRAVKDPFWVNMRDFADGDKDRFQRLESGKKVKPYNEYTPSDFDLSAPDGECSLLVTGCTDMLKECLAALTDAEVATKCAAFIDASATYTDGKTPSILLSGSLEQISNEVSQLNPELGAAILNRFGVKKGAPAPSNIYPFRGTNPPQINRSLYQSISSWYLDLKKELAAKKAGAIVTPGSSLSKIGEPLATKLVANVELAKTAPTDDKVVATRHFFRYLSILVQYVNANRNILNPEELDAVTGDIATPKTIKLDLFGYVPVSAKAAVSGDDCKKSTRTPLQAALKKFSREYKSFIRNDTSFRLYNPESLVSFGSQSGGGILEKAVLGYKEFSEGTNPELHADLLQREFEILINRTLSTPARAKLSEKSIKDIHASIQKLRKDEQDLMVMLDNFLRALTILNRSSGYVNGFQYGVDPTDHKTERDLLFTKHRELSRVQGRVVERRDNLNKIMTVASEKLFGLDS